MNNKVLYDKQIKSVPRKLEKAGKMFNEFNIYSLFRGNEIGWMWKEGSEDQKMAYNYNWRYKNWERKSAWANNWMHGLFVVEKYPYCVENAATEKTYYYFGKKAAEMMSELFSEALEMYKDFGQRFHSKYHIAQNISWLEKNIKKFENCSKNEITAEQHKYNRNRFTV